MIFQILIRRDTTANWTLADPVLAPGEPALDTDTGTLRYGNGVNRWSELPETLQMAAVTAALNALTNKPPYPA